MVHVTLGKSNREIGISMGVAESTAKTWVARLMVTLNVHTRAEIATYGCLGRLPTEEELMQMWMHEYGSVQGLRRN